MLTLPFLPYLHELSFDIEGSKCKDLDLISWFPFHYRNPTIIGISLDSGFTSALQLPPDLPPNLQFLDTTPAIIERLIPGNPVNKNHASYLSGIIYQFP